MRGEHRSLEVEEGRLAMKSEWILTAGCMKDGLEKQQHCSPAWGLEVT